MNEKLKIVTLVFTFLNIILLIILQEINENAPYESQIERDFFMLFEHEEINSTHASVLFERSLGKLGLAVEILREAIKRALNSERFYPTLDDYIRVIIDGTEINLEYEEYDNENKHRSLGKMLAEEQTGIIVFDINDLRCKVPEYKSPYSKKPYKSGANLLKHYRAKHPRYAMNLGFSSGTTF